MDEFADDLFEKELNKADIDDGDDDEDFDQYSGGEDDEMFDENEDEIGEFDEDN